MRFLKRAVFFFILIQFFSFQRLMSGTLNDLLDALLGKDVDIISKKDNAIVQPLNNTLFKPKVENPTSDKGDKTEIQINKKDEEKKSDDPKKQGLMFYTIDTEKNETFIPFSDSMATIIFIRELGKNNANIVNNVHVEDSKSVIQESKHDSNQIASNQASQVQDNKLKQAMRNDIKLQLLLMISQISKNIQEFAKKKKNEFLDFYKNHKLVVIGGIITVIYLSILIRIKYLELRLLNKKCWSFWKKEIQLLKDLIEMDRPILINELLVSIEEKYNTAKKGNFFLSVVSFLNDIENESKLLATYLKFCSLIKKMKVGRLFFINEDLFNHVNERIDRLAFLKDRLLTLNQYKNNN